MLECLETHMKYISKKDSMHKDIKEPEKCGRFLEITEYLICALLHATC